MACRMNRSTATKRTPGNGPWAMRMPRNDRGQYTSVKVGRNDAYPCLSGVKHKRCCGAPVRELPSMDGEEE